MRAGRLNTRVGILRKTRATNTFGEEIETWNTIATVWAEIVPLRGAERFAAMQTVAQIETKVRIRYRKGLTPLDRLYFWEKQHDIIDVVNLCQGVGFNRTTEIYTKARGE